MNGQGNLARHIALALAVVALLYAACAGLRTVGDFDLGWQLATGRYVLEHRHIPSTDVFSYTARGNAWVYPPFSGILFCLLWLLGGYQALSLLGAAACIATTALLLWGGWSADPARPPLAGAALAIVAVPLIAARTTPRADLFTTLLFAAFLAILWRCRSNRGCGMSAAADGFQASNPQSAIRNPQFRLALLPVLMLAWVNLHLGFVAGLGLVAGWVAVELLELPLAERRPAARQRLRRAAPWLAATAAATLLNPWGPLIYAAIVRQNRILRIHTVFVGEWTSQQISPGALREALAWRSPDGAYWWLLMAAIVAMAAALWRREFGTALLLAAASVLSIRYVRFQVLFACIVVVIGGHVAATLRSPSLEAPARWRTEVCRYIVAPAVLLAAALVWIAGARISDLASNTYYLSAGQTSLFGAGESWWYPERAAAFLLQERLPANIFHDYNLGGYLVWRLGPRYPDYLDGRAVPFGAQLFFRQRSLQQQPPDSPAWREEADRRNINTLIFSVARYAGLGGIPLLKFCSSSEWAPVYLDEVAAIFVRNRPENMPWISRLKIDCQAQPFGPPAALAGRAAGLYNYWANAGAVLYMLERDQESWEALERARRIYPDDGNLYLTRGQLLQANNRSPEALREYETAVRLKPTDAAWYALGRAYAAVGRFAEAAQAIRRAAQLSIHAYDRYRVLGQLYLKMEQPREALEAFNEAQRLSPFQGEAAGQGSEFDKQVAAGRARALDLLGKVQGPRSKGPKVE
jgi:tetratricopeptide (TPR) repeat protein